MKLIFYSENFWRTETFYSNHYLLYFIKFFLRRNMKHFTTSNRFKKDEWELWRRHIIEEKPISTVKSRLVITVIGRYVTQRQKSTEQNKNNIADTLIGRWSFRLSSLRYSHEIIAVDITYNSHRLFQIWSQWIINQSLHLVTFYNLDIIP